MPQPSLTTGGCLCGNIRYESPDTPENVHFCHCTMCRKMSGGPFAYLAGFKKGRLRFVSGEPAYYRSSEKARRGHCPVCGSHLTFEYITPEAKHVYVSGGSLDRPDLAPPIKHVGASTWLPWLHLEDGLERGE